MPRHLIWRCLWEQTGQRGGGGGGGQQSSSGDEKEGGGGLDADAQEGGSGKALTGTAAARLARMALQVGDQGAQESELLLSIEAELGRMHLRSRP